MKKFFKKLWFDITILFHSIFRGLRDADILISRTDKKMDDVGVEKQNEQDSVYHHLLRGEVTQEVIELRYEMYHAERKSYDYVYAGNGRVKKKDESDKRYDDYDGLEIRLIQDNNVNTTSLSEFGIDVCGDTYSVDGEAKGDLDKKERLFSFKRNILPRYNIEKYISKLVVKNIEDNKAKLEFYTSCYPQQFDNHHKMFVKLLEKGEMQIKLSDIVEVESFEFITHAAYGAPDMNRFEYNNLQFESLRKFDGNFILTFIGNIVKDGDDIIDEVYDEIAAKKFENHEARTDSPTLDWDVAMAMIESEEYDDDTALSLMEQFNNGQ